MSFSLISGLAAIFAAGTALGLLAGGLISVLFGPRRRPARKNRW